MKILLVDDNPGDVVLIREMIKEKGGATELQSAGSLSEAIQRLEDVEPDAILLGLNLPDSQGLPSFVRLKAAARGVPIVVLTGQANDDLAIRAVQEGAQDYLVKGQFDGATLMREARFAVERRKAEQALRTAQQQLLHAQKMDAIGRLAGGIAHDFNNILTVIVGAATFARDGIPAGSPALGELDEILKNCDRAAGLTRQLLAFGRQQALTQRLVGMGSLLANLEKMLRRIIGEDIALEVRLPPSSGKVLVDPGQFEQVVMNLVVNAREAMPSGGRLSIATEDVELDEGLGKGFARLRPGPYVRLAVRDTGIGMDEDVKAKIFEPFFTTKAKGHGLGLATVYGIVKQHGGEILVQSERGKGTEFSLYFPRRAGEDVPEASQAAPLPPARGSEVVLLVEDDSSIRRVAERMLGKNGYRVLSAEGPNEALRIAQETKGPIDLLLTDFVMPEMTGAVLAERFRALFPGAGILFMSGYSDRMGSELSNLPPGAPFVSKPFKMETFVQAVRQALNARAACPKEA